MLCWCRGESVLRWGFLLNVLFGTKNFEMKFKGEISHLPCRAYRINASAMLVNTFARKLRRNSTDLPRNLLNITSYISYDLEWTLTHMKIFFSRERNRSCSAGTIVQKKKRGRRKKDSNGRKETNVIVNKVEFHLKWVFVSNGMA